MRGRERESKRACVGEWYHVWGESAYTFARVIIMGERTASTSVVVVVRAVAGFVVKTIKTHGCGRLYKSKVCVGTSCVDEGTAVGAARRDAGERSSATIEGGGTH